MSEIKFRDGVPCWDGTAELFEKYKREALLFLETLEWRKRETAAPRLIAALEGPARVAAQQRPSAWFSHPKGVADLLDLLKATMRSPTLPEAGRYISKFFFGLKRRKGETMAAWLVRHDDALDDAKRALSEAIREYGPKAQIKELTGFPSFRPERDSTSGSRSDEGHRQREEDIYDDHGRLIEEEEANQGLDQATWAEDAWMDHGYNRWWQGGWSDASHQRWERGEESAGRWSDVKDEATHQAERFLPDFVIAWMLLQRSGLDQNEKGALIANLKNEFTMEKVKAVLRLNWPEDELRRRDSSRGSALVVQEADDQEELLFAYDDEEIHSVLLATEGEEEYHALESEIQEALQGIQLQKNTLKQAREKQQQIRQNRKFFDQGRGRGPGPSSSGAGSSGITPKCLRCGGRHWARQCPQKQETPRPTGSAHFVFVMEEAFQSDGGQSAVEGALATGKAIIDGGATASVGSIQAMEKIRELAWKRNGTEAVEVLQSAAPSFKFGNNGKVDCASNTSVQVPMDGRVGSMQVAVHEIQGQPVLMSIQSLRSLGAVIDFDQDQMILKKVNPTKVIDLERAPSGHQLFPMVDDVFRGAKARSTSFVSLLADS
eukprot:s1180_g5.t1